VSPRAFISGCQGPALSAQEYRFFAEAQPWGLILFSRNLDGPASLRALVAAFREAVGRADAPVLIDQEGGRVQRLRPPFAPLYPPAGRIGALFRRDQPAGERAAWLASRLIGEDLWSYGITVDCLPVLDLRHAGAHQIVGDRAYGDTPDAVIRLGGAAASGLGAAGVAPVAKHVPGHGRALADSHERLPVVTASRAELAASDCAPFRALAMLPMAMTAHVLYTDIDADRCATLSARVVGDIIRGEIGFDGLLMSDDLSMGALTGSPGDRAAAALAAGCDIALHCNGDMSEMAQVAERCPPLSGRGAERAAAALAWAQREAADIAALRRELGDLIEMPLTVAEPS
jgi:beta-N-acetylhexosaminidase